MRPFSHANLQTCDIEKKKKKTSEKKFTNVTSSDFNLEYVARTMIPLCTKDQISTSGQIQLRIADTYSILKCETANVVVRELQETL